MKRAALVIMVSIFFGCRPSPPQDAHKKFMVNLTNTYVELLSDSTITEIIMIETKDSLFIDVIFPDSLVHFGWAYLFAEDIMSHVCEQDLMKDRVKADIVFSTPYDENGKHYFYTFEIFPALCPDIASKLGSDSLYKKFHDYVVFNTMPHDGIVLDHVLSRHWDQVSDQFSDRDIIAIVMKTLKLDQDKMGTGRDVFDVLLEDTVVQNRPRLTRQLTFFKSLSSPGVN